jgi:hypothetical protein
LILSSLYVDFTYARLPRVAVCVCGMASRFQPESVAENLLAANEHEFDFDVFLSLQTASVHFSSPAGSSTKATAYTSMDNDQLYTSAMRVYSQHLRGENWSLTVSTRLLKSVEEYAAQLGVSELNGLSQGDYWVLRHKVFAMFINEEECARSIVVKEVGSRKLYDYIIMARDDTYVYRPIELARIVKLLNVDCTLITRDCLEWGGIATRMQVATRMFGLHLYETITEYYKFLIDHSRRDPNTEIFEKNHVEWVHGRACPVSVEILPVSVSRFINKTEICFIHYEIDNCVPRDFQDFVRSRVCQ